MRLILLIFALLLVLIFVGSSYYKLIYDAIAMISLSEAMDILLKFVFLPYLFVLTVRMMINNNYNISTCNDSQESKQ